MGGLIDTISDVDVQRVSHANVVPTLDRRTNLNKILDWLSSKGLVREKNDLDIVDNWDFNPLENVGSIVNVGRFAQWKYYWTDDCVLRAKNVAYRILKANNMERVLITGCLGFVGVNLAVHFLKQGIKVYGIDNRSKVVGSRQNHELLTLMVDSFIIAIFEIMKKLRG